MMLKNIKNYLQSLASPTPSLPGFTFIEMMIALTLLATFGTSLFLVQSNILSKVFNTHRLIVYSGDIVQPQFDLSTKVQQAIVQKKSPDNLSIEVKKKNPQRTITAQIKMITEQSSLYKTFGKQVRFIQTTVAHDQYKDVWHSLQYIPELSEKEKSAKTEPEAPKAKA